MTESELDLWKQMANLTLAKCKQKCKIMGACCDLFYCGVAKECAESHGQIVKETGNKIPFLDNNGTCIMPPQFRQMCSLHQCDISNLGVCIEDPEWTRQYFELRQKLEELGWDKQSEM